MEYTVIPFVSKIQVGQGEEAAAQQLQELINEQAEKGWQFIRLENIEIITHDHGKAGTSGCFGIGATPGIPPSQETTRYDMAVFGKSK